MLSSDEHVVLLRTLCLRFLHRRLHWQGIHLVGSEHNPVTRSHALQPALVAPRKETLPLPVEFDTAKMEQSLRSLRYPAHATTIEPFAHDIACRPLNDTRRNH